MKFLSIAIDMTKQFWRKDVFRKEYYLSGIFIVVFVFLTFFNNADAQSLYNPLSHITGNGTKEEMVVNLVAQILKVIYAMVVTLAIIMIVWGGIGYMASFGKEESMTSAKKTIIMAIIGLALAVGAPVFIKTLALQFGADDTRFWGQNGIFQGVPAILDQGEYGGVLTLAEVAQNVINLLLTLLGMFGVIGIVLGGIWYLTSGGDQNRMELGKKTLLYSIIGLAISIGSLIIVKQVAALF